ncbi:hypothetical protein ACC702_03740 [Rhizobium ruizarguesonis]
MAIALEIPVSGEDLEDDLAKRYGYINRAIPDEEFVNSVDAVQYRFPD